MRLIDADEIRIKPDFIFYGVCGTPVIRCEDLARIINDMPTIEPQKWVSCSERLPEEKKEVLVSADGDLYIAILETINGELSWSEVIEYRYIMGVDAWMPLPEPWKEEEG